MRLQAHPALYEPHCEKDFAEKIPDMRVAVDAMGGSAITRWSPKCPADCPFFTALPAGKSFLVSVSRDQYTRDDKPAGQSISSAGASAVVVPPSTIRPLALPEKVTIKWLIDHVPAGIWTTLGGVIVTAFLLGIQSTRSETVRDLAGLPHPAKPGSASAAPATAPAAPEVLKSQ
jgi:hypothetical protein